MNRLSDRITQWAGGIIGITFLTVALGVPASSFAVEWADMDVHGFADIRGGVRTQTDPHEKDDSLGEARVQLESTRYMEAATLQLRADLLYDWTKNAFDIDLEEGRGWIDLREANILFSPASFADVKMGRQILTWGTGDLLFINDLFPKDWQAFFIGRDEEYLKAPSDAALISIFPGWANIDIAYTPRFDADRSISGERISYWNSMLGDRAGRNAIVESDVPDEWFSDDELAVRISRNAGAYELAAYAYRGFWKSPAGIDPATFLATHPELNVYGASVRGPLYGGIFNVEGGYYDSRDDTDGKDAFVRNSEARFLMGYERELARDFSAAVQYYLEQITEYDSYRASLPPGSKAADEDRHVVTLRLTRQLMNQKMRLSLFTYFSPSDQDGYARPSITYKATDAVQLSAGGNYFWGEKDHTFFGQFEQNNNVYAAVRYSF